MLVHVAGKSEARSVVDIGCGAGYDLQALRAAYPDMHLTGVEPNLRLCERLIDQSVIDVLLCSVDDDPKYVESADLLVCLDVLEHVPDPETFLGDIAKRAKLGAYLFESTGNEDCSTPLHLTCNRGWHPGRVLERNGFVMVDLADRVRVWQRRTEVGAPRAGLILCAYRGVSAESLASIMALTGGHETTWRLRTKVGDSWIGRSRSIAITRWWSETNDDVFLMIDDDVAFTAPDAERIVELCRAGLDIVCGAYPVHSGAHLSLRCLPGTKEIQFGPGQAPIEVHYAATGFMAVHRRVIDALIPTLPLVSPRQPWLYYPLFPTPIVADEETGDPEMLSEDWGFCRIARDAGFRVWLDPQTKLSHGSHVPVTVSNMAGIYAAIQGAGV
jgi:SAM-dependent methyltransferase